MKVLVLGVTGMLGSAVFKTLSMHHDVYGTVRNGSAKRFFSDLLQQKLIVGIDVLDQDALVDLLVNVQPDVVVNCVGLIKQLPNSKNPLVALPINAMFPHRLARLCGLQGCRLIHISTDCVFSGDKGMYLESDESDAKDLYGKSKYIGELHDYSHCVTLRTSIIGHELNSNASLVDWFLSQEGQVKGFTKAIFSGLPTAELAQVINYFVLPSPGLSGLYHVSAEPIDKYSLLNFVKQVYGKSLEILPDDSLKIDRSLDSNRFRMATGYAPKSWPDLIQFMYEKR
ncbi:SDR family oxidoreductase [Methylomarinum sp. Ch1-1]|uniref:dTDP-4-dehydrorhamnose reductase n=1 Tax=Methylomarinum roseum TaxID=3067653 RepID=A0AAU7NVZ3_9GAMM